jgi:hypothetical protein
MTIPRAPRAKAQPARARSARAVERPYVPLVPPDLDDDTDAGGPGSRTTRRIALAALALAIVAVGLTAWRIVAPADAGCQAAAWDVAPVSVELPAGWTTGASQYDVSHKSMSFLGPVPASSTANRAVVYATITCYPQGAADSVTRSADAARAAGQTVTALQNMGEQGFSAADPSGATFLQFRRGSVVVYVAASGAATVHEADAVAAAFDHAMGGAGQPAAVGTPDVSAGASNGSSAGPAASAAPSGQAAASASPAAPDLEAALPTKVGTIALALESALGPTILGSDQGSRAITAALRSAGRSPSDLRVAQAYDPAGQADLAMVAMSVTGMSLDSVRTLVLDSWLAANGAGVKQSTETIAGHTFTKVDYGDNGTLDYVLAEKGRVIIIETTSSAIAAQAAAALP